MARFDSFGLRLEDNPYSVRGAAKKSGKNAVFSKEVLMSLDFSL
jgi:hypothetical protein